MATPLDEAMAAIDAETNNLATVVQSLRDTISTGMTQIQVDEVKARAGDVVARLQGIARDSNTPVPPGPPPAPLAVAKGK